MPAPAGERPRQGARPQRDHGKRARPARLRRPRGGAGLPRRRAAAARSRSCSATWTWPSSAIRAAIAAGKRICVHGDYDVDGICATVLARARPARARRRRRMASAEPLRRGLRRQRRDARTTRRGGLRSRPDGRLRHHRGRRGAACARARPRRDRHRPPPPGRRAARTARSSRRVRPTTRSRSSAAPASSTSSARRCSARTPTALRRHLDLVALATIADVVPLVGENRSLAIAGLRALARTQKPGLQALMKVARVDPAAVDAGQVGVPARAAHQRRRAARPSARGARAAPDGGRATRRVGSPTGSRSSTATGRRSRTRSCARRSHRSRSGPRRSGDERAYVVWGEDWHEGVIGIVASRLVERYNRPVVLIAGDGRARGRGRAARSPSFDLHGALARLLAVPRALRRPPRRGRPFDPAGAHRAVRRRVRRAGRRPARPRGPRRRPRSSTRCSRAARSSRSTSAKSCGASRRSGSAIPTSRCSRPAASSASWRPSVTASICGSACSATGAMRAVRSHSARARSSTATGAAGRYDVAFRLQENHWNGTVAPQLVVRRVFDADDRFDEVYDVAAHAVARDRRAIRRRRRSSTSSRSRQGGPKRHPLESETFRALLAEPALLRAA